MNLLDLSLPNAAENLALDEALLETAEAANRPQETLRLWEAAAPMVVVGRASKIDEEVDVAACQELGIPILRRHSGGAAIVAGPGCLMYGVVLDYRQRPHLRMIDEAHKFVLETIAAGLRELVPSVERQGISDLTIETNRKFSGNSLRCCRNHLLYHGTLLYDFPLELIGTCLKHPPRQPDYRAQRLHGSFVTNLSVTKDAIRRAVVESWRSAMNLQLHSETDWPEQLTARLVSEKYCTEQWNSVGKSTG